MRSLHHQHAIALDCDGVLLDYGQAYGKAWQQAFGDTPTLVSPNAYWPMVRWGVPRLEGESLEHFRCVFDQTFWSTIPPLEGALQACQELVDAGFNLVCVTALDEHYLPAREQNLRDLGFPIQEVIATPHSATIGSPKASVLNALMPAAFVDDYAPYLNGVHNFIHKALIVRDPVGSPNTGDVLQLADSTHADLHSFVSWWVHEQKRSNE